MDSQSTPSAEKTVLDLLADFALSPVAGARSAHTRRAYLSDLRAIYAWYQRAFGSSLTPGAITPDVLVRYGQWCRSRVHAATFNRRKAALSAFCRWAVQTWALAVNPIHGVRGAKW
jgi:site-specific recombinase XerC